MIDEAVALSLDGIARAFSSQRHKTLDATSGVRDVAGTARIIMRGLLGDIAARRSNLRSLQAYERSHASAVNRIRRAFSRVSDPDPTAALVNPAEDQRIAQAEIETVLADELAQGRPFSNHMRRTAVDISVRGLTADDRLALINAALADGARVIIEGPESSRNEALRLRQASGDKDRVSYRATDEEHIHLDLRSRTPSGTVDPRDPEPAWLPSSFTIETKRSFNPFDLVGGNADATTWHISRDDSGAWHADGGKGGFFCAEVAASVVQHLGVPGFELHCSKPNAPDIVFGLPDFSREGSVSRDALLVNPADNQSLPGIVRTVDEPVGQLDD